MKPPWTYTLVHNAYSRIIYNHPKLLQPKCPLMGQQMTYDGSTRWNSKQQKKETAVTPTTWCGKFPKVTYWATNSVEECRDYRTPDAVSTHRERYPKAEVISQSNGKKS